MAKSWQTEIGTAGQITVNVNIPYMQRSDIYLYSNKVLVSDVSWDSDTVLHLPTPLAGGEELLVMRRTERDYLRIQFSEGAAFDRSNLDEQNTQFLYLSQELVEGRSIEGFYGDISMNNFRITNLGAPVDGADATNKTYVDSKVQAANQTALRVPESSVSPVPTVEGRRGKLLGFDSTGAPVSATPVTGSATELELQLQDVDGLSTFGRCASITGLREVLPRKARAVVGVMGYTEGSLLGGGLFEYLPDDKTSVDDGGRIIVGADGSRWRRMVDINALDVTHFGAVGNGLVDDTAAIQKAIAWAATQFHGAKIYVPEGRYALSSTLILDGDRAQVLLEGAGSGVTAFSWVATATAHGILGGLNTPISRFHIKGIALTTDIVGPLPAVKMFFNHGSPKSFHAEDIQCYGSAVGGDPTAGYFAGGMFDLVDPVYPVMRDTIFNGMGGSGINVTNNKLISSGIILTAKNSPVLIANLDNCNVTGADHGLILNSQQTPGIEGTFIRNSNFGFVNSGIVANASGSGNGAYFPPQVFIHNCQIEYLQVGIEVTQHSVVDISDTLVYTDSDVALASSHVILNNCKDSRVHDCHMESRPSNASVNGVTVMGASSYVEVYDNQITVPASNAAVVFSDTSSYCKQRNNVVKGGSEYVNSSSNASTNTAVSYQTDDEVSFQLDQGYVVKKGSKVLRLGSAGTFSINFEGPFNSKNITTLAMNGDAASGTNSVVLTNRDVNGFSGYFVGGDADTVVRINYDATGK